MNNRDERQVEWRTIAVAGASSPIALTEPTPPRESKRGRMVRWFSPRALLRIAWDVLASSIIGKHADARLIEALSVPSAPRHDYSSVCDETGDFWFDYVADIGDGWNSTYAIAHTLSSDSLVFGVGGASECETKRGSVLVFGGDAVYPTPSAEGYEQRTEAAYRTAFCDKTNVPDVFAVPGNHDWYDSLVAFSRVFVAERHFGPCPTRQKRSYFALKLPCNWWLLGVDVQLGSDIDAAQKEYFESIAQEMDDSARIILCVSEPHWIYSRPNGSGEAESNLVVLEQKILKHRVVIFLAGDLHHYQRHQGADGVQKIVCGGGGAFLHSTSRGCSPDRLLGGFVRKCVYPSSGRSLLLSLRNLGFFFLNPEFSMLLGSIYMATALIAGLDYRRYDPANPAPLLLDAIRYSLVQPGLLAWLIVILGVFVMFTDDSSRLFRASVGLMHGSIQVVAAFLLACIAYHLFSVPTPASAHEFWGNLKVLGSIFVGGALVGSTIFGVYLCLSLVLFGKQSDAAFSSLRIQDWKSFLRFRIHRDGGLEMFVVGINRVPRKWTREVQSGPSTLLPDRSDARASGARLVERVQIRATVAPRNAFTVSAIDAS